MSSTAARGGIRAQMQCFERERIVAALAATAENQTRAAQLLGISRRTLTNKLNVHRIARRSQGAV